MNRPTALNPAPKALVVPSPLTRATYQLCTVLHIYLDRPRANSSLGNPRDCTDISLVTNNRSIPTDQD